MSNIQVPPILGSKGQGWMALKLSNLELLPQT